MLTRLKFLLSYFVAWVVFFEIARLVFLFYNYSESSTLPWSVKSGSFLYGLRMDVAVAAYLLFPVALLIAASVFIPLFRKPLIYEVYSYLLSGINLMIVASDLEVYKSWGFRMDATPLRYLNAPREALASVSHLPLFWIFLLLAAFTFIIGRGFRHLIRRYFPLEAIQHRFLNASLLLVLTAALIIPARGGLQLIPMNQSSVYFSHYNFANIMAINPTWNVWNGLAKGTSLKNPYNYMDAKKAHAVVDSLYRNGGEKLQVLNTSRPNVILVIWESFTEKALHATLEGKPVMPRFQELKKEGIYFSNMYASGDRTDKGVAAVLSGYPALNNFSIIRFPDKSAKLPVLSKFFKQKGYTTSFYYGGETEFANIKSYVLQSEFERIVDKADFPSGELNSKWGAHDGAVASRIVKEIKSGKPFFTTWLTLTSHEPFEIPVEPMSKGKDITTLFMNSLHYTDEVLYQMVQQCKQQSWWQNTVMIIVADHGHTLLNPSTTLDNRRIPALWLGGALVNTGIEINEVSSQLDLAGSLAQQVEPGNREFAFSQNLFDSSANHLAFFTFNNGFGLVQPHGAFAFDNVGKQVTQKTGTPGIKDVEAGKALQQVIYQDYLSK